LIAVILKLPGQKSGFLFRTAASQNDDRRLATPAAVPSSVDSKVAFNVQIIARWNLLESSQLFKIQTGRRNQTGRYFAQASVIQILDK
jgi:hypothetical protein